MAIGNNFAATIAALNKSKKLKGKNLDDFNDLVASDPRATGAGFDRRTFGGNGTDIGALEAFAVNESREAGSGAFREISDSLFKQADQVDVEKDAAAARARGAAAGDRDAAQFERRTRSLGLTDRQRRSAGNRLSLNRAVSEAAAGSGVRRRSSARARNILSAAPDFEALSFQQEISGLTGLANADGQRRIRLANEKAADKAERNGMIGTAIGTGLSLLSLSSEPMKDKREENPELLSKLKNLRIDRWNYKGREQGHVGPYAEEFNETFGTEGDGGDKRFINLIDAVGVALGAVKQLDDKLESMAHA